jgi:hypothetical protein
MNTYRGMNRRLKKKTADLAIISSMEVYKKIGLITLAIGIFSALSFLTTYSFLYGYYFGGEINNSDSNFDLYRRFVPFHINTMTFTYLMISLSVSLIIYSLKIANEKENFYKVIAVFCIFFLHVSMTIFFSREITMKNLLIFSLIWVFPILIGMMILFFINGMRNSFKTISGGLLGVTIISMYIILQEKLSEEWSVILLNIALFTSGIILSYIKYGKYINFIFVLPYSFILTLSIIGFTPLLDNFKDFSKLSRLLIAIIVSLIISIIVSRIFKNNFIEKVRTPLIKNARGSINKVIYEFITVILNPKTHKGAILFVILMLLGAYVMIPRVSISTAKIIRSFTPSSEIQYDLIFIKDYIGKPETVEGMIVAEQDNVIYISNENWELEQVKISEYYVIKQPK